MAYRFKLRESLRDGVRRIAVEQIERVLQAPRKDHDRVAWVHETRKAMKRNRALLRCVRSALSDRSFREENAALAGIARSLSGLRDRDVMADTIARLNGQDDTLDEGLDWLARRLDDPADESAAPEPSTRSADAVVRRAVKALEKAEERLAKIAVAGELVETVGAGLRAGHRAGREALARLDADASDDNVHDLRKAVQTYQRQQALVHAVWPAMYDVRIEAARMLAQLLGEAQDFAVLAAAARSAAEDDAEDAKRAAPVLAACRERQETIRGVAAPMAARPFCGASRSRRTRAEGCVGGGGLPVRYSVSAGRRERRGRPHQAHRVRHRPMTEKTWFDMTRRCGLLTRPRHEDRA